MNRRELLGTLLLLAGGRRFGMTRPGQWIGFSPHPAQSAFLASAPRTIAITQRKIFARVRISADVLEAMKGLPQGTAWKAALGNKAAADLMRSVGVEPPEAILAAKTSALQ